MRDPKYSIPRQTIWMSKKIKTQNYNNKRKEGGNQNEGMDYDGEESDDE